MKKKIIVLVTMLMSMSILNLSAKIKVEIDQVNPEGSRIIQTSWFNAYTEWSTAGGMCVGAGVVNMDDKKFLQYFINMTLNEGGVNIDKGSKLLMKLGNNDIIELEATDDFQYDYRNFMTYPRYWVTEAQLLQMVSNDVVKLRIQTQTGFLDRVIKKNKISNGIKESVPLINAALKQQKDIYSDF